MSDENARPIGEFLEWVRDRAMAELHSGQPDAVIKAVNSAASDIQKDRRAAPRLTLDMQRRMMLALSFGLPAAHMWIMELTSPQPMRPPGYWLHETSGALRPAVVTYLEGGPLTPQHIAALRAYFRQWIEHPGWEGPKVEELRRTVGDLNDRQAIRAWLRLAFDAGCDPI